MFGSTKNIAPEEPKLFGAQRERVATNESGRVLPWFAGTRWLGVTWVGDPFYIHTTTIGHVGERPNYYASFVALVGNGPVDRLLKVRFDDEIVWEGPVDRGDEPYVTITFPNPGTVMRFYWGTDSQVIDSHVSAQSDSEHSAYRGQAYIVGELIFFGNDKTTAPNIEIECARWGRPSWLTEAQAILGDCDSNPMAVLWEWWTNPRYGLGRSEADLDLTRLTAAAEQLRVEGLGVSPLLTSAQDLKSAIIHLFEHIDAYPTSYGGKFGVELVRSADSVKTITKADLLDDPTVTFQTWAETFDEVRVKFKDRSIDGQDNVTKHHDLANFQITGTHRASPILERPWVVRQEVAIKLAGAEGRSMGQPQGKGRMMLRESAARIIDVGSVFQFVTRDSQTLTLRCLSRSEPAPGKRDVEIEFETDRGWANAEYFDPPADEIPETPIVEPLPPYDVRIYDAPYALAADRTLASLLYLVARNENYSTEYDVWKSAEPDGGYESAAERRGTGRFRRFPIRAKLSAEYTSATYPVDEWVGISFEVLGADDDLLAEEWDYAAGLNHELLAVFGSAANEIMSLWDVVKTGATTYTAKTIRGLYDTRRRTHAADTEMWIQARDRFDADAWPPLSEDDRYYKAQTVFVTALLDLGDVVAETHTENARTLLPIAPLNLAANGDGAHPTWITGDAVAVSWSNTSRARTVFGLGFGDAPATDLEAVSIEIRSADGLTLHDTVEASTGGETLNNAYLVATVNADFLLRAYGVRSGRRSLDYTDIVVRKV